MFWKIPSLCTSSPVDTVLDKENFTLEELLDEEEIIQECKALNSRLINFLRDRSQVEQLLRYIVEEPLEDAESKRTFKFPYIACEVFTCEIDVILKALVEEEELMNLLFSFLEPDRPHSALLAGYFSKVVICLMLRKMVPLTNYVQAHPYILCQLVDLIGITSIMEVLVRLVGAEDHIYSNATNILQWLADSNLLEMIVDKLSPSCHPEVHANAAETLCAITRNAPSPLATKLSSPSFVARIFGHALEDSQSKSGLVHSLSVCVSLLDPKRSAPSPFIYSFRSQHSFESPIRVDPVTVNAMLPKLGDLLLLLNVSSDEKILQVTYGELRPPLGKHRLKIVEFIAVLLKNGNEVAAKELVSSGTILRVLDLFFEYPYNNALHHQVESIMFSCLESKQDALVNHLLGECDLVVKILQTDKNPILSADSNQPTLPAAGKPAPRVGNLGHITQISNKLVQLGNSDSRIQAHLQENGEWNDWQATVLQERNFIENVSRWACGRPSAMQDRTRDSDEDDINERDYDVAALANNLSQAFRYTNYDNNDSGDFQGHVSLDRVDEDAYFDDESAEVVISSLRLGDDQGSVYTNSNWFAFQDDNRAGDEEMSTSPPEQMDEINLSGSSDDHNNIITSDEVIVGEDELIESKNPSNSNTFNGFITQNEELFEDGPITEWVGWGSVNPFDELTESTTDPNGSVMPPVEPVPGNYESTSLDSNDFSAAPDQCPRPHPISSFVGVEVEGTEKAMDQALKEGTVGEAGPLKRNIDQKIVEEDEDNDDGGQGVKDFNDVNYWKVDQEIAGLE